ncbi:MAG: cob(I)yrinic acid a,c-diamide adenosyltransferase [Desulfobulbaceae bacterium]|jgi:cob(I)alamin adenosyltransferase|nr:cob(I)yrinic acid a,c-diamide adenosyltransferase [Desulfobulbaceae bacterium]
MAKGLFVVYTGNGKGKTTASLGMAVRALGHGYPVTVIQFIKGNAHCGEHNLSEPFAGLLQFHVTGKGFTWKSENLEEDIALARAAWDLAARTIAEGKVRLLILDELTYLIRYKMVDEDEILEAIGKRPDDMDIVVTGRHASEKMIAAADLVTEMTEIKHPYSQGIPARKGVDF